MLCSTHRLIHSMHVRYRHGETLNGMGGVSETVVLSNLPYFRRPQHPKRRGRRNQSLNWNNRCWHIEQAHQYTQPSSLLEIAYKKHLHMAAASNIEATHIDCTRKFRQKTLAEKNYQLLLGWRSNERKRWTIDQWWPRKLSCLIRLPLSKWQLSWEWQWIQGSKWGQIY